MLDKPKPTPRVSGRETAWARGPKRTQRHPRGTERTRARRRALGYASRASPSRPERGERGTRESPTNEITRKGRGGREKDLLKKGRVEESSVVNQR